MVLDDTFELYSDDVWRNFESGIQVQRHVSGFIPPFIQVDESFTFSESEHIPRSKIIIDHYRRFRMMIVRCQLPYYSVSLRINETYFICIFRIVCY